MKLFVLVVLLIVAFVGQSNCDPCTKFVAASETATEYEKCVVCFDQAEQTEPPIQCVFSLAQGCVNVHPPEGRTIPTKRQCSELERSLSPKAMKRPSALAPAEKLQANKRAIPPGAAAAAAAPAPAPARVPDLWEPLPEPERRSDKWNVQWTPTIESKTLSTLRIGQRIFFFSGKVEGQDIILKCMPHFTQPRYAPNTFTSRIRKEAVGYKFVQKALIGRDEAKYVIGYHGFFSFPTSELPYFSTLPEHPHFKEIHCVALEKVDSDDLLDSIDKQVDPVTILENFIRIAKVLRILNEKEKVLFFDLKAENVFLRQGIAVLGDLETLNFIEFFQQAFRRGRQVASVTYRDRYEATQTRDFDKAMFATMLMQVYCHEGLEAVPTTATVQELALGHPANHIRPCITRVQPGVAGFHKLLRGLIKEGPRPRWDEIIAVLQSMKKEVQEDAAAPAAPARAPARERVRARAASAPLPATKSL